MEKEAHNAIKKIDEYAKSLGVVIHRIKYCFSDNYQEDITVLNTYPKVLEVYPNAKGFIEYL